MDLQKGQQFLKTRDDPSLLRIEPNAESTKPQERFLLADYKNCSWLKAGEAFGPEKLRPRIEPWLTAIFQSEHLSLLIGAGLPFAIHKIATGEKPPWMTTPSFGNFKHVITKEAARAAKSLGRNERNIEDQFRAANELLRGLEILALGNKAGQSNDSEDALRLEALLNDNYRKFADSILCGELGLLSQCSENRAEGFSKLISFLMSFASRSGTRERLHIFTTNYDRYIEAGADAAGLHLIDRFVGTLSPMFRSSRLDIDLHYNPPGIRGEPRYLEGVARFTKLHGSVDWVYRHNQVQRIGLPFGALNTDSYLAIPGYGCASPLQLMIYPNAAKDRETAFYPYVELFRDFAAAICRPNSTLVCYGYSFGDEHINRAIEDMLTIPSAHLVIISYDDRHGGISKMYERLDRPAQMTLLVGDHLADLNALVERYLPKAAIDLTTERMAALLQTRWNIREGEDNKDQNDRYSGEGTSQ